MAVTLLWIRRDFRLTDHTALTAAVARGGPVIPVFICDEAVDALGAAPKWRMGAAVAHFDKTLQDLGSRLILRSGPAEAALQKLVKDTGADAVYWSRSYDPDYQPRDAQIKTSLQDQGVEAKSFTGHLLFEPWSVETKTGGFYKVYTPMWKAVRDRVVPPCLPAPSAIPAPQIWPDSDALVDWNLGAAMRRGAAVVAQHAGVGEAAAQDRLDQFLGGPVKTYKTDRNSPALNATSRLSENLTYGEISPRQCWHAAWRVEHEGQNDAEHFLKEVVWREFAFHLLHHTPHITKSSWREGWDGFGWQSDETADVMAWKQGRTGIEFVDAAMRELYVTGTMHNRARMIVASFLTKHLMTHWKIGMDWFADCLIDWDPAANAMGWQWTAGCGPDASPYFRIFNPETQLEKFDPLGIYKRDWIAEISGTPTETALSYFDAVPKAWGLSAEQAYPEPVVSLKDGRDRALEAYSNREF